MQYSPHGGWRYPEAAGASCDQRGGWWHPDTAATSRTQRGGWWHTDVSTDSRKQLEASAQIKPEVPSSAIPYWGLLTFTFILVIGPQWWFPVLIRFRIAMLAAGLTMVTYLIDQHVKCRPLTINCKEMRILAALVGWAGLTVPLSYWPGGSVAFLQELYLKTIIFCWLVINILNTPKRLRQMAWWMSILVVPLSASGIQQYLMGAFLPGGMGNRIAGYASPLAANPNDLALLLNLILPFSIALFMIHQSSLVRMILLVFIVLSALAVFVTYSRSGFLTLATIFTVYLWKYRKRSGRGWTIAVCVIMVVCIPLIPSSYVERLQTITDIEADATGSAQSRTSDMITSVNVILKNPIIGSGIGQQILALNRERGALWHAVHNVYLEHAIELGLPGLSLFLWLFITCLKDVIFVWRQCADLPAFQDLFYLAEGVEVSLIAFAIGAMFSPVSYHLYFYFLAGIAIAIKAVYTTAQQRAGVEPFV